MFAMAIWDRELRELTLVRDLVREKPLYYAGSAESSASRIFAFGSELKALRAHPAFDNAIDRTSLDLCCAIRRSRPALHLYAHPAMMPGCMLPCRLPITPAATSSKRPIGAFGMLPREGLGFALCLGRRSIEGPGGCAPQAIAGQMVADVPVGAFLSGGVDSSTHRRADAAACVATCKDLYNRLRRRMRASTRRRSQLKLQNILRPIITSFGSRRRRARRRTPLPSMYASPSPIPRRSDEPHLPMARKHVTVALSGDAGDEMFGGYNRYIAGPRIWRRVRKYSPAMRRVMGQALLALPAQFWDKASACFPCAAGSTFSATRSRKLGLGCAMRLSGESLSQFIALLAAGTTGGLGVTSRSRIELDGIEEIGGRPIA